MKKLTKKKYNKKKRIFILICLIMLVILEIVAFKKSKANKILDITASIIDSAQNLDSQEILLQAKSGEESGYFITLPEYIDNKKIDSYIITEKVIHLQEVSQIEEIDDEEEEIINEQASEQITEQSTEQENEQIIEQAAEQINEQESENVEEQVSEQSESGQVNEQGQEEEPVYEQIDNTIIKLPGEILYLTDEEVELAKIELNVEYSAYQKNDQILYEQIIQTQVDDDEDGNIDSSIKIEGFMPIYATIQASIVNMEEIETTIVSVLSDKISFKKAYDIKIIYNEQEYEPTDFDINVKVTISGIDSINLDKQKYKVVHIDNEETVEEVQGVQTKEDSISFPANSFSTYALLLEDGISTASLYISSLDSASVWDGSVAENFRFGTGTSEEPYLITNASELAYFANQVNSGNTYDGTYVELIADINLNNREWTPIGDLDNPFKGVFNGSGHSIANATISLPDSLPTSVTSYGFFGSIGDGNSKSIIKNLQLENINIEINASGTTANNTTAKGYYIGIVTGTIYNNAEIKNVIVNNGNISDNYTMTIRTNSVQVFVGGIAGFAVNSENSITDPGDGSRYAIENCYSNTNISLDISLYSRRGVLDYSVAAQYAVGGIIGGIRTQPVWPENCLFTGSLDATNGFTGPIFGYLRNATGIGTQNNYQTQFNTLWQGNDAGDLTMTSYYTSYSTNDRAFSNSEESGTSSSRITTNISGNFDIGYVQGVNKGIYINSSDTMLSNFNNYVTNNSANGYMTWYYDSSTTAFYFIPELTASVEKNNPIYTIIINDKAATGNYTYSWYINGSLNSDVSGDTITLESNWTEAYQIEVLVSNGLSYAMVNFEVPKLEIHVSFEMDNQTNVLTGGLEGTGTVDPNFNLNDYTYQWYKLDIADEEEIIEGENTNKITGLENGMQYKLVATNTKYSYMTAEGIYTYGTRTVIYCSYTNGNDNNDGFTPDTPVKNLSTAYGKFEDSTTRNENVIVLMGTYSSNTTFNSATATTYRKNVTITGKYQGTDYDGMLYFEAYNNGYKYLNGNTTFMHLKFYGSNSQAYLYLQGYSLTMGEGIIMQSYATSNTNQGLIEGNAPAFHIFAGWLQYDETRLPRTGAKILIKSGTYARVLLGGSSGNSDTSSITKYNSHNFMGTSLTDDLYQSEITIDIKNSTTATTYAYDVNLLGGGSTCGNIYGDVKINVKNGNIGRLLGASIGDSSYRPNNWQYPLNTFIGTATINMTGGNVTEMYGGCLGRNMSAIGGSDRDPILCDSYFYGTVNINISGGVVSQTIYGAGAGGVSGYSEDSTDTYKSYGQGIETIVNINISGGTIDADIYGGGYGYTNYLTANSTQTDGGTLYGNSNINISGSPTINGSVYGGGRGYNLSTDKPDLALMDGNSTITISGMPTITGNIYGAGMGLAEYENMAMFTGATTVNLNADLSTNVFGGGNIAKTVGNTYININSGIHTAEIYGGGNVGILEGTSNVTINGGTSSDVYGGGKLADITTSKVYIKGGENTNVYGGGNQAGAASTNIEITGGNTSTVYGGSNQSGTVNTTSINANSGTVENIFGGNNEGGTCPETNVTINGTVITEAAYGGGNQVSTENTNIILNNSGNEIPYIFGGGKSADATNTNVTINGGSATNVFGGSNTSGTVTTSVVEINAGTIENVYGGNNAGGENITSNVNINGGNSENVYGGNNAGGENITSNVNINGGNTETVYGGNNLGGTNTQSNLIINNGNVTDVYGGGNQAVTNAPNVTIQNNANVEGSVYGGGNQAGIETDTRVDITGGTIAGNVYGGGNEGIVTGNTYVNVKNATLQDSLYAGGNGITAIVYGNANVIVDGTDTNILGSVFGGGNKAATGTQENNNSLSTVNIVGGNIGKNVYGGANTSVVYGNTLTNIGYDAVGDTSLIIGDITIGGTVFGGGEANASGSEIYDFSFISVTVGIDININGKGHNKCQIKGSIFGSGNASSTSGYSYINVTNYGTVYSPQKNISIQRANIVTLDNSAMSLSGTKDRTNEYSDVDFTLSRVDELKLKNNSIIYLDCGANLLKKFTSCVDENGQEVKAVATIDETTGETTRNVDNRIYMLEGKNLNIATNEQVTAYGEVSGMTFFGLYTNSTSPSTSTGLYNREYNNGDVITNAGTFSTNSYVRGLHKTEHDITIDGFYTNYDNEDNTGYIKTGYINPTPKDDVYYIWLVGLDMDVTTFEVALTASKYATLGTYELGLTGFSDPNIKFTLIGFSAGLSEGISLVQPSQIESVAINPDDANTIFGLTMKTGNNGWTSDSSTTFLTANGGTYTGSNTYNGDNSTFTPALNLCLYHSENITIEQKLGNVKIRLQAQIPKDDLNVKIAYIDIIINMTTALYQNDFFEAAITPGEQFELFTTTETNITDSSVFSEYYSLYIPEFSQSDYYEKFSTDKHVLVSRKSSGEAYVFPQKTKMTMIDMITNKYYYYVISEEDENSGKYVYNLEEFVVMGSDSSYYNAQEEFEYYYNEEQDLIYENFIFHIDFSENNIEADLYQNALLMELRDEEDETLIGVLGIQRDALVYSVYKDKSAKINVTASTDKDLVYLGNKFTLTVETDFKQEVVSSKTIYDTQFFDDKMGVKISIFDNNGNSLSSDSLLGISFELNDIKYYPRIDGTIRICTAEKVSNVLSKIIVDTENNTVLPTGEYTIKVESFGSPDGIYYGIEASDSAEVNITIIESTYGLKAYTDDESKIIEKDTGYTQKGNNDVNVNIEYSSGLENPNIAVSLYRRDYSSTYSQDYELVDLADYVTIASTNVKNEKEYIVSTNPTSTMVYSIDLASNLITGTYKIVFKLYDGDEYIGEVYEYFIIK